MSELRFQERIEGEQKRLDEAQTDMAGLIGICEAEDREMSDVEKAQFDEYSDICALSKDAVTKWEKAEIAMGQRVTEKAAPAIAQAQHLGDKERPKGDIFFKRATAHYLSHVNRVPLEFAAKEAYPHDLGLQAVIKSTINPAKTDVDGWAEQLTETANQGYLDILRGVSVTPNLWAVAGMNLNFDGYTGLTIPNREGTDTDLASGWVGEAAAIAVRRTTFGSQTINPYKWANITTMSKEIISRSTPAIQALIQNAVIADTATKLDNDYLGEAAGVASYSPAGIMFGVTGTPAATGGATTGDDMLTDLKNLLNPFYANNMGQTLRIMMHPSNALAMSLILYNGTYLFREELSRGTLFGVPVLQSTNIPIDELQAVDMAEQAIASGPMNFEVSDTATIVEMDTDGVAPFMGDNYPQSPSGAVGGAAPQTPAASVRSLFQTETVALKNVQMLSWKVLRVGSVNRITGVSY
jgi:hypothetical protein